MCEEGRLRFGLSILARELSNHCSLQYRPRQTQNEMRKRDEVNVGTLGSITMPDSETLLLDLEDICLSKPSPVLFSSPSFPLPRPKKANSMMTECESIQLVVSTNGNDQEHSCPCNIFLD